MTYTFDHDLRARPQLTCLTTTYVLDHESNELCIQPWLMCSTMAYMFDHNLCIQPSGMCSTHDLYIRPWLMHLPMRYMFNPWLTCSTTTYMFNHDLHIWPWVMHSTMRYVFNHDLCIQPWLTCSTVAYTFNHDVHGWPWHMSWSGRWSSNVCLFSLVILRTHSQLAQAWAQLCILVVCCHYVIIYELPWNSNNNWQDMWISPISPTNHVIPNQPCDLCDWDRGT